MKTQNVVVDIGNLKASDIFFVQGEQGREITFKVINSLLEDFVNLAEYTATIHILKSDGNFTIDTMTIDSTKSECYYTLTENDCACGGRGFYDLSFSKNDELIYTAHGDFVGDFRSVNDDSVASVSSAYGVTFPEGFQQKLIAGDKIHISDDNVISAEGEIYTAGDNINISDDNVISATDTKYTAGDNIEISQNNVISANISDDYSYDEKLVGKWVDGKNVYKKTFYNAGGISGNKIAIPHNISNLANVIDYSGSCYDTGLEQAFFPFPHISTDRYNMGVFSVDSTNIYVSIPPEFGSRIINIYITIYYVKN